MTKRELAQAVLDYATSRDGSADTDSLRLYEIAGLCKSEGAKETRPE